MSIEEVEKKYPSNIPLELKISLDHLFYDLGIEKTPNFMKTTQLLHLMTFENKLLKKKFSLDVIIFNIFLHIREI